MPTASERSSAPTATGSIGAQRAWNSLLKEWDVAGIGYDEGILQLLNRSYQFLAPRFMPVTEWTSLLRPAKSKKDATRQMVW